MRDWNTKSSTSPKWMMPMRRGSRARGASEPHLFIKITKRTGKRLTVTPRDVPIREHGSYLPRHA